MSDESATSPDRPGTMELVLKQQLQAIRLAVKRLKKLAAKGGPLSSFEVEEFHSNGFAEVRLRTFAALQVAVGDAPIIVTTTKEHGLLSADATLDGVHWYAWVLQSDPEYGRLAAKALEMKAADLRAQAAKLIDQAVEAEKRCGVTVS